MQKIQKLVIVYAEKFFGIFGFLKFILLYVPCGAEVKQHLYPILIKIQCKKGIVVKIVNCSYINN